MVMVYLGCWWEYISQVFRSHRETIYSLGIKVTNTNNNWKLFFQNQIKFTHDWQFRMFLSNIFHQNDGTWSTLLFRRSPEVGVARRGSYTWLRVDPSFLFIMLVKNIQNCQSWVNFIWLWKKNCQLWLWYIFKPNEISSRKYK